MNSAIVPHFKLETPPLPDISSIDEMIAGAVTHRITGSVAAVSGETIELEGMTAPIGAVCALR